MTAEAFKALQALSHDERVSQLASNPMLLDAVIRAARQAARRSATFVTLTCEQCRRPFAASSHRVGAARYCSHACRSAWLVANPDKNPRRVTPDRFWAKVDSRSEHGCWPWTKSLSHGGYGIFQERRKMKIASRRAYELAHGPIPAGLVVRHKCDNRACCRPDHLELGTTADNQMDKVIRGRSLRGERHTKAVLSEQQVIAIRSRYRHGCGPDLAAEYGVSAATILAIVNGRTWRHLRTADDEGNHQPVSQPGLH